jgi:hypothetical protein
LYGGEVKKLILLFIIFLAIPLTALSETVTLLDGRVYEATKVWEEDGKVHFIVKGFHSFVPREDVNRIGNRILNKKPPIEKKKLKNEIKPNRRDTSDLKNRGGYGVAVKRLYKSSSDYVRVVIETNRRRRVKCAVYDANDNPISVREVIITPPLDEFPIRSGDRTNSVTSVKCWTPK